MKNPLLLIYAQPDNPSMENLRRTMAHSWFIEHTFYFSTLDDLETRLVHRAGQPIVAILIIDSEQELYELIAIDEKGLFQDVRLILLLPDLDQKTLSLALRIRPRFFTHSETGLPEALAVLAKMIGLTLSSGDRIEREESVCQRQ